MRWLLACVFALWSLQATAKSDVYDRGEFHFSVGPAADFVEPVSVAERWPADAPGANGERWRNWSIDYQVDHRHGRTVEYYDHAYEAVSPELLGDAAKFQISFSPDYQTLTIHGVEVRRDGQWSNRLKPEKITLARRESKFEQDMSNGQVAALIVLDDVRPTDVVRVRYSIEGSNPVLAGQQEDQLLIGWDDPILDRSARFLYDPGTAVAQINLNSTIPVEQKTYPDRLEYRLVAHALAAIRDEGSYPLWYSQYPKVQITPRRSWADVVNWALPLYPQPGPLPADLEARIAQWRALPDPAARVAVVLRAVQDEVRYFGVELGESSHRPSPPATTWTRRYGDCKDKAYLLSVILRELGITAEPALVSSDEGRRVKEYAPSAALFNHVIARVHLGSDTLWVDPTQTLQRGELRHRDVSDFGYALPIVAGTTALVEVRRPADVRNEEKVAEDFQPSADGKTILLTVETSYAGSPADRLRRTLASHGPTEMAKRYADYYRKRFGDLDVIGDLGVQDDGDANRLHLTERYRLKEAWSHESQTELTLDAYADALAEDARLPTSVARSAPIALSYPMSLSHETRLELPADWHWLSSPEDKTVETAQFRYHRQFAQTGQVLLLSNRLDFLGDHVPLAALDEYVRRMREVNDGLSRRFVVRMPGDSRQEDREQRLKHLLQDAIGK